LILKNLDDDDKNICKSFFPPMFGEEAKELSPNKNDENMTKKDKENTNTKYKELKIDYQNHKAKARNAYDFYNLVEKSVLEMEEEEDVISEEDVIANGLEKAELQKMC